MALVRGNLIRMMAEVMVNTMVLILRRYLEHLRLRTYFSLERYHLADYNKDFIVYDEVCDDSSNFSGGSCYATSSG